MKKSATASSMMLKPELDGFFNPQPDGTNIFSAQIANIPSGFEITQVFLYSKKHGDRNSTWRIKPNFYDFETGTGIELYLKGNEALSADHIVIEFIDKDRQIQHFWFNMHKPDQEGFSHAESCYIEETDNAMGYPKINTGHPKINTGHPKIKVYTTEPNYHGLWLLFFIIVGMIVARLSLSA